MDLFEAVQKQSHRCAVRIDDRAQWIREKMLPLACIVEPHVADVPTAAHVIAFHYPDYVTLPSQAILGNKAIGLRHLSFEKASDAAANCDSRSFHRV